MSLNNRKMVILSALLTASFLSAMDVGYRPPEEQPGEHEGPPGEPTGQPTPPISVPGTPPVTPPAFKPLRDLTPEEITALADKDPQYVARQWTSGILSGLSEAQKDAMLTDKVKEYLKKFAAEAAGGVPVITGGGSNEPVVTTVPVAERTPEEIKKLSRKELRSLTAEDIGKLSSEQLNALLDRNVIYKLADDQINFLLTPEMQAKMTTDQVQWVSQQLPQTVPAAFVVTTLNDSSKSLDGSNTNAVQKTETTVNALNQRLSTEQIDTLPEEERKSLQGALDKFIEVIQKALRSGGALARSALISLLKAVERFRLKPNYAAAFGELGLVMEKNPTMEDVQAYALQQMLALVGTGMSDEERDYLTPKQAEAFRNEIATKLKTSGSVTRGAIERIGAAEQQALSYLRRFGTAGQLNLV